MRLVRTRGRRRDGKEIHGKRSTNDGKHNQKGKYK